MKTVSGLRWARESVGATREELSISSGVSVAMICAVEKDLRRPSAATSEALERGLLRMALARLANVEQAVAAVARLDRAVDVEPVEAAP